MSQNLLSLNFTDAQLADVEDALKLTHFQR